MDIIAFPIVQHNYSEESLMQVFSVDEKKRRDFEWNSESNPSHPINEEISVYDYVYSIQNIDNPHDEYGFCFLNETILPEGNYLYTLEGLILDSHLTEAIVNRFVSTVVGYLNHFHREKEEDAFRTDRINGPSIQPLPLAPQFINDSVVTISSALFRLFIASRDGIIPLTEEQEKWLKKNC
jgi:hypothetical protein